MPRPIDQTHAVASPKVTQSEVEELLQRPLLETRDLPQVVEVRHLGGMAAVELRAPHGDSGYLSALGPRLRAASLQRGVLLRPLGNVLYALPPACADAAEVDLLATTMCELVHDVPAFTA